MGGQLPIALGHAVAVLTVVLVVMALGQLLDPVQIRRVCGLALIGWAAGTRATATATGSSSA